MSSPAVRRKRRSPEAAAERKERRAGVTDPDVVMEAAAAFLAVRPRSVHETRQRLVQLGYQPDLVATVVERLVEIGYLDDEGFARAWVESRDRARPRGEHALRLELGRKGIERQTIDAVLDQRTEAVRARGALVSPGEVDGGPDTNSAKTADTAAAERLIARRRSALLREPDPRKRRAKAYALLARKGFDPDVCRTAAAHVDEEANADDIEDAETA